MGEGDKNRWPIRFSALRPPTSLTHPISIIAIVTFIICLVIAMLALGWLLADLVSGDQKRGSEAAKTALPILAGAIGLPLIIWRLLILDRQTRISEEKTQIDRETHYTSIFSRSVDQIGQTRELKSNRDTESGSEIVTRTVPNIEVRLGGIHSLSRLAEESRRDRAKIENTLLSYVRENSWLDRDGARSIRPEYPSAKSTIWSLKYRHGTITQATMDAYNAWKEHVEKSFGTQIEWANSLSETRVDVNEAIDAVYGVETARQVPPRFFESLFVGRQFTSEQLARSRFERCTFFRCNFSLTDIQDLTFENSNLYNCTFVTKNSKIMLDRCRSAGCYIDVYGGEFSFIRCNILALDTDHNSTLTTMRSRSSFFHRGLLDKGNMVLAATGTIFSACDFNGISFQDSSQFIRCTFAGTSFNGTDLSRVELDSSKALFAASGDAKTQLAENISRPTGWPPYDFEATQNTS